MTILDTIAAKTKERVETAKRVRPPEQVMAAALATETKTGFPFEQALSKPGLSFICEVKKASPSKGLIVPDFDPVKTALLYEKAGADAISVLTEPFFFQGDDLFLAEIAGRLGLPLLRKDFVVDEYMLYEAKLLGASAVLLIAALLSEAVLGEYIELAHRLGLSALVEVHTEEETKAALSAGARIIGVNNRDLKTFSVDLAVSARLRPLVTKDVLFVYESGIQTPADTKAAWEIGADAVLIGETLMRAEDPAALLQSLSEEVKP